MHVRCPHCHNPIDVVDDAIGGDITCPSCGSGFSLIDQQATVTRTADATGRTIAHFELVRELGVGQFGSVWMAKDTKLDRTVAVKIPRREALSSRDAEMFLRDARAAAQLKHPNIVPVHEVGKDDDTLYIVSDYIEGASLKSWLTGKRLSSREAAILMVKVAEAVHHAHEQGVVHRDLKPGNIMLDEKGDPHVIDFGMAKRDAGEITMTVEGQILGTPAYMPPEQAGGKGHEADARSDVYSLGVILFELLTGELPFRGDMQMLLVQIKRDEPPRPRKLNAKIPRDLETITLKCIEKEPAKRYVNAKELADDLDRWINGLSIIARPIGYLGRARRWIGRNPVPAALTTALAISLVCGTGVSVLYGVRANLNAKSAREHAAAAESQRSSALLHANAEAAARRDADKERQLADAHRLRAERKQAESERRKLVAEQHQARTERLTQLMGLLLALNEGKVRSPALVELTMEADGQPIEKLPLNRGADLMIRSSIGGYVSLVIFEASGKRIVFEWAKPIEANKKSVLIKLNAEERGRDRVLAYVTEYDPNETIAESEIRSDPKTGFVTPVIELPVPIPNRSPASKHFEVWGYGTLSLDWDNEAK